MKKEIYDGLKRAYECGEMLATNKEMWAAMGEEGGELSAYDFRLLSIYFKDLADDADHEEHPLLQIRVRTPKEEDRKEGEVYDYKEEMVFVFNSQGMKTPIKDNLEYLFTTSAEIIEEYTEDFLTDFPDAVLRWDFMGQDDD